MDSTLVQEVPDTDPGHPSSGSSANHYGMGGGWDMGRGRLRAMGLGLGPPTLPTLTVMMMAVRSILDMVWVRSHTGRRTEVA